MKSFRWFRWRSGRDLEEEIQTHIDLETREKIGHGFTPEEARYAALRSFGNRTLTRERAREADPMYWFDTLTQDVRFGMRQLRRTPLLTATVALTLILGTGLNSSVFTIIDAILLRPLVTRSPETFAELFASLTGRFSRNINVHTRGVRRHPEIGPLVGPSNSFGPSVGDPRG